MVSLKRAPQSSQNFASNKKTKSVNSNVSTDNMLTEVFRSQSQAFQSLVSEQNKLLASRSMPSVASPQSEKPAVELCKAFQKGFYKFGDRCRFRHEQHLQDRSKVERNDGHYRCKCGQPASWKCATWSCRTCCLKKSRRCELHQKATNKGAKIVCRECGKEASPACKNSPKLCKICCPGCDYHKDKHQSKKKDRSRSPPDRRRRSRSASVE